MNEFRMDNTEGYDKGQLDEMNRRLVEWTEGCDIDDINYSDNLKHAGERIQKEYDNELIVEKAQREKKAYDTMDELMTAENQRRKTLEMELCFSVFRDKWKIRGEIEMSNADPVIGYKKNGKYYLCDI